MLNPRNSRCGHQLRSPYGGLHVVSVFRCYVCFICFHSFLYVLCGLSWVFVGFHLFCCVFFYVFLYVFVGFYKLYMFFQGSREGSAPKCGINKKRPEKHVILFFFQVLCSGALVPSSLFRIRGKTLHPS